MQRYVIQKENCSLGEQGFVESLDPQVSRSSHLILWNALRIWRWRQFRCLQGSQCWKRIVGIYTLWARSEHSFAHQMKMMLSWGKLKNWGQVSLRISHAAQSSSLRLPEKETSTTSIKLSTPISSIVPDQQTLLKESYKWKRLETLF